MTGAIKTKSGYVIGSDFVRFAGKKGVRQSTNIEDQRSSPLSKPVKQKINTRRLLSKTSVSQEKIPSNPIANAVKSATYDGAAKKQAMDKIGEIQAGKTQRLKNLQDTAKPGKFGYSVFPKKVKSIKIKENSPLYHQ